MGTFQLDIDIHRPPGEVFAFVAEPSTMVRWYEAVDAVSAITAGPTGPGARFQVTRSLPGGPVHNAVEITDYQPDRRVTLESTAGPTPFRYRYAFEPTGHGTRLTLEGRISSAGLPGRLSALDAVATHAFKRGMQQNLNQLKRILEAQPR